MKKLLIGILVLVLICSSTVNTSSANTVESDADYGISTLSELEEPLFPNPFKKP